MSIEPFIAFFLVAKLKKRLVTPQLVTKWKKKANVATIAIVALFVIHVTSQQDMIFNWVWHIISIYLFITITKEKEFEDSRYLVVAALPVLIVSIVSDIAKLLPDRIYETISNYIGFAFPFSVVWMIYMFITSGKQQKALEKEKIKREQEEALNREIASRKAELEVMVSQRTAEIMKQKEELELALEELKSTQAQLIQSEKMASLGELTAGIAHEIQNPLNFVNNFSEVSSELIGEMNTEIEKGEIEEAKAIANNIRQNLEKIIHHGKRADAIVKDMLQHSGTGSGQKEPTNINSLADEYLRLSYHGLRAKNKFFNATLQTDFDETIDKINIIPQDMGRVLLNLFNNAFYAVMQKKKLVSDGYEPTVQVSTKKLIGKTEITVKDNGTGIPQKHLDKIYQPFFTTKPTGQGTGLGLSLSYDIIKAHGGEIKVETKEGEGTAFTIQLPLN